MTREEAIQKAINIVIYFDAHFAKSKEAREDAANIIEALEQEPCEDCISRKHLLEEIASLKESPWFKDNTNCSMTIRKEAIEIVEDLCIRKEPCVNPQKIGHWILTDDDFVYCSECEDSYYPRPIDASWYYCPHCGAKMVESEVDNAK